MRIQVFAFCWLGIALGSSSALAMDADLWAVPPLPQSSIVWKDELIEMSNIIARGTHLRSELKPEEIINFYQEALLNSGWQLKDYFKENNIIVFSKEENYLYLGLRDNGAGEPVDVYLVKSPASLALCAIVAGFLKDEVREDLPGRDLLDVPRYPGSKRILSIFGPEQGNILFYVSEAKVEEVFSFYQETLPKKGWQETAPFLLPNAAAAKEMKVELAALMFNKDNKSLIINIYTLADRKMQQRTLITLSENLLKELGYPKGGAE